ncbi:DHHW family protein [Wukongibacter sp. M2B1]|uniref:DHHW family protein n=1 Tax=Wukongibacter sp. M2B1 TaxID=3088895 RepID=UPI003D7B0758
MGNKSNKIIIAVFILFLLGINILNLVTPDRNFSEFENRMLAQFPNFKFKNLVSGRFTSKFEEYTTDQFAFRDFWVAIKSDIERLSLKTINNGIFFGKDGYLMEEYKKPNEQLNNNIEAINDFSEKLPEIAISLLLAPNSLKIYEDKLPLFASPYNQLETIKTIKNELNQSINLIDVYEALEDKRDEYIYFKTDHHWTMRGAYYGYQALSKQLGIEPYKFDDFNIEIVTDEFYGSYYSKANNIHIDADAVEVFRPEFDISYKVNYLDEDRSTNSLYELEYLDKKDKYSMFLDGNHALMTIETSVNNGKKLVVFKDSYAHAFIPFLANHYEEIHVIDLRYYKLDIYKYIKENKIKEVLFLYNVGTFSKDGSITGF